MDKTKKLAKAANPVEARAKEIALAYERRRILATMGEDAARLVREVGQGGGYEIISPDGRMIEVKGTKGKKPNYGFVINSEQELSHIESGGFVYRVTSVFDKEPLIYILSREHLHIAQRYRADVRILRGSAHEIVVHEEVIVA